MFSLIRSLPLLLGGLCLSLCHGAETDSTKPLRVGVTPTFPPIVYKEAGKLIGAEIDLANAVSAQLGRPMTFTEVKWEDQIPSLVEGKIDIIMSGMSVTRTRQLRVGFANPYLVVGQGVLVRREDFSRFTLGFPPIPKGVIGVLENTTGDFLVQQEFPRNKRKAFSSPTQAARALEKKQIDILICDSPIVSWLASMNETQGLVMAPILLSEEPLAWAVRKADTELLASLNRALEKLQKSGQIEALLKRWVPIAEEK